MQATNTLWILVFVGFWVNYMLRNNINIAIIGMIKQKNENENETEPWTAEEEQTSTTFEWDSYEISLILSSYFWMHWAAQLPGGILSHRYGTKVIFGLSNLLGAICTLFLPIVAKFSFNGLMVLRIFMGFIAGASWPSMQSMVAKWIPPKDRATFLSSYLGSSVGIAFTYASSGYLIEWFGWESVFYIQGILAVIWWIVWEYLVYENPFEHPWMSIKERKYIVDNMGDILIKAKLSIPWKEILWSRLVWINIITQFGAVWGLSVMIGLTPVYMKFIHGVHIKSTGVITGMPHITRWLFAYSFGKFTQYQKWLSLTGVRKLSTTLCTTAVGVFFLLIAYSNNNADAVIVFIMIAITLQGTIPAGPMASLIDISPNFSSVLQGISGTISVMTGFIAPLLIGYLTKDGQTEAQWCKFFWISALLCVFCGLADLFFSSSELQSWNLGKKKCEKNTNLLERESAQEENK